MSSRQGSVSSKVSAVVSGGRAAFTKGFWTAVETAVTDYISYPYAEAFARTWDSVDLVPGWLSQHNAAVLFAAIQEVRPSTVVEIGSYLGRSTVLMALGQQAAAVASPRLVAIDPHTGDRQHLEKLGLPALPSYELFRFHLVAAGVVDAVEPLVASSAEVGLTWNEPIDFLFIDGWHSYDAVLEDGRLFLPHLRPHGVVIFDDYRKYTEVAHAVVALDREGAFRLWGTVFGQAIGGKASAPVPGINRMLRPGQLRRALRVKIPSSS